MRSRFQHSSCRINSTAALRGTFILELMPRSMYGPFFITILRENLANRGESSQISVKSCPIRHILNRFVIDSLTFVQHILIYFANRNEFLRDSSSIEPITPNIRNDIVSESGLSRRASRWEKIFNETSRIPPE